MSAYRRSPSITRRLVKPLAHALVYLLAFALPTLATVAVAAAAVRAPLLQPPPSLSQPLPAPPAHDPARPTAVVVAGNLQTESTDLLAPYEVLGASGAFNLYVVAPERRLATTAPSGLDVLPHYSLAQYDQTIGVDPDLIVVPAMANTRDAHPAVLAWIRKRAGARTIVLSVCAGAKVLAETGLLDGRRATSNVTVLPSLEQAHPAVQWVRGVRYAEDGNFISSAGITSGVDATLYAIQRLIGREAAEETARRVGYPHTRYLDERTWWVPDAGLVPALPNALPARRATLGLVLYDGVGEIELGSVVDTYPHAYADVHAIAPERRIVRTRHGLDVVPRFDLASAPSLDRLLIPGRAGAGLLRQVGLWASSRGPAAESIHASGAYPYDVTLADIARRQTRAAAASVARDLEYPIDHLRLEGSQWPLALLAPALAAGALGLALAFGAPRALRAARRRSAPHAPLRPSPPAA